MTYGQCRFSKLLALKNMPAETVNPAPADSAPMIGVSDLTLGSPRCIIELSGPFSISNLIWILTRNAQVGVLLESIDANVGKIRIAIFAEMCPHQHISGHQLFRGLTCFRNHLSTPYQPDFCYL